jgi:hypothetical protein
LVFCILPHQAQKENGGCRLTKKLTYKGVFKKIIFLAVVFNCCLFANAQSDEQQDSSSVVADTVATENAIFSETDPAPDTLVLRSTPDTIVVKLQHQKEFAYANDPEYWKKQKKKIALPYLGTFLKYAALAVFVGVLIYILVNVLLSNKIILFNRNKKSSGTEMEEQEVQVADLSALIALAEQQEDFRLATRYQYLQLLDKLNTKQLIRMHPELTNWDYIRQLGKHPLNAKFRYLTAAYEYTWYGEFRVSAEQYQVIKNRFQSFV